MASAGAGSGGEATGCSGWWDKCRGRSAGRIQDAQLDEVRRSLGLWTSPTSGNALTAGMSTAEIVRPYPTIVPEDVRAAAAYGAWLTKQEIHALSVGA